MAKTESESDYLKAGGWTESDNQQITRKDAQAADKRAVSQGKGTAGVSVKDGTGPNAQAPGWAQDGNGWWYRNQDGSYPVGCWQEIGGKWYLFDINGYMLTGWPVEERQGILPDIQWGHGYGLAPVQPHLVLPGPGEGKTDRAVAAAGE